MPATKSPPSPRPLSELEAAEQAVATAVQKAELAREEAERAREQARMRQAERERQWADCEIGDHADAIRKHAEVIGACRLAFEQAVLRDPPAASAAYLAWVDAMAQRHAAEASFDLARGILGQPAARLTEWPDPGFMKEADGILQARTYELLEEAIEVEKARRVAAFNGTGQESK